MAGSRRPVFGGTGHFQGEELVAEVYEDDALKMRISEPFPHDEFILVLNGMQTVTDASGVARTYTSGDSLVLRGAASRASPVSSSGSPWRILAASGPRKALNIPGRSLAA